jgi:hypothetical protein
MFALLSLPALVIETCHGRRLTGVRLEPTRRFSFIAQASSLQTTEKPLLVSPTKM